MEIFSPAYSNPPAQDHTLKTDIQEMSTVGYTLPDQGQDKHTDSAAPRHTSHPCSSPTICTPTCPTTYWTQDQGTSPRLEQCCQAGTNLSTSLAQLVAGRLCPAYLVPGIAVQGRCIPGPGLDHGKVENRSPGNTEKHIDAVFADQGKGSRKVKWKITGQLFGQIHNITQ